MEKTMLALQSEQQRPQQTLATQLDEVPLPCQQVGDDDNSQTSSVPYLPEDIWRRIHFLMPMDAAARAACLSHTFLSSWRCYPKLALSWHELKTGRDTTGELIIRRVDSILRNHSGIGLKRLWLHLAHEKGPFPYIDTWLRLAVTPGIQDLKLWLYQDHNFPCSLLQSDGVRDSLGSLQLDCCTLRPAVPELGPLRMRSLTRLRLGSVRITGEELERLLSSSLALEHLKLDRCEEIILLRIPSVLQQLSYLKVFGCGNLQVIENKAPNLRGFRLTGEVEKLSLGEASQRMIAFSLSRTNTVCAYALAELPSIMPNLEYLCLSSIHEVNTPMLTTTKFLNLKRLDILMCGGTFSSPFYDYFSLVSFLYACPSLEIWYLNVYEDRKEHESVFGGSSRLRQLLPQHRHNHLKSVRIVGFKSARSLVELTCCIVRSAVSLEQLTLDTSDGNPRCSWENDNGNCCDEICSPISKSVLEEASRAALAITRYIEDKVPPTAKLTVMEPCPCPECRSTP